MTAREAALAEALTELVRAASEYANATGGISGDLGARLTDARAALHAVTAPEDGGTARDLPDRVVVGANGAYWRDYGDHYSMCPVSDDNDPVEIAAIYVRQSSDATGWDRGFAAGLRSRSGADTAPEDGGLDAAWAEAEAALPDGWQLQLTKVPSQPPSYEASAEHDDLRRAEAGERALADHEETPAAALRALAARLRAESGEAAPDA